MIFTTAQKDTLLAYIKSQPDLDALRIQGSDNLVADALNVPDGTFKVWNTTTPVGDIQDAINWSNFTPAVPALGAGLDYSNQALACQGKQFNLQLLLSTGSGYNSGVSTGKANVRAGLQDALTGIPSGASGATRSGGWAAVQLVIQRFATRVEKLFATGTGTTASPASLVLEGSIHFNDLFDVMHNPDGTLK